MNKKEIFELIKDLAKSQGFYGRILENITEEDLQFLEDKNFKDTVELVMFLEGC